MEAIIWMLVAMIVYGVGRRAGGQSEKRKQLYVIAGKLGIGMAVLAFYYVNLSRRVIDISRLTEKLPFMKAGTIAVLLLLAIAFWLYGAQWMKRDPERWKPICWCLLAVTPFLLFFIMELCWNDAFSGICFRSLVLNLMIYMMLEIIFVNLFRNPVLGLGILYMVVFLVGALNYYLVEFRGQPLLPTDLFAIRTASSVAGQYSFGVTTNLSLAFLGLFLLLVCMWDFMEAGLLEKRSGRKALVFRCGSVLAALTLLSLWVGRCDFAAKYRMYLDFWWQRNTYSANGFAPSFISFWQKMKIDMPDGYTEKDVEACLMAYTGQSGAEMGDSALTSLEDGVDTSSEGTGAEKWIEPADVQPLGQEKPTIITIMNESFSDLSVLGPLDCTDDDLAFLHSLKDDPHTLEFGWNYVSTRGGGTSTTEFEYLTGDSMAFTNGINPYSSFNFTDVPSMVSILKTQGYHTIAMHPENPNNWRRSLVYPKLGFDEFYSISAFEDKERTVWNRVSDLGDYQKLIEIYEEQTEPSFIFNVTMQNHGGYDGLSELKPEEIVDVDKDYAGYPDFQMYESLIAKSDHALAYLIHYFEQVDQPVILCFFGDHQPALNGDMEWALRESGTGPEDTELSLRQKYYAVPYFIWSNYDIGKHDAMQDAEGRDVISTNYLGALVRRYAGLPLSAYDHYRLAQRAVLPVFNFVGYMTENGSWHSFDEESPLQTWIDQYRKVQYYALFDKKRKLTYF